MKRLGLALGCALIGCALSACTQGGAAPLMPQDQARYEENGGSLGGGGRSGLRIAAGGTQTRFETSADNGGSLGGGGR